MMLLLCLPSVWAQSTTLVIDQAYGGGGSVNALYSADFVEIFNLSGATQSLNGLAVQYISAAGTSASASGLIPLPNVSLAPGQRFLVVGPGTCSATGCITLPTPDLSSTTLAASGTAGRLYLTSINTALTQAAPACPTTGIIDYIGYGSTAACSEGGKPATATTTTKVDVRNNACIDTDNNAADFSALDPGTVPPRTMSSTATPCSGGGGTTGISVTGAANPTSVYQNSTTILTATVTPGSNPASTNITVTGDLSNYGGGSKTQPFYDDGTHGDTTAGDGVYTYTLTVPTSAALGSNPISITASDGQSRTSPAASIAVTVLAPVTLIPIHTIQGNVAGTAADNGQTVMTAGIITGVTANGFYLQSRDVDADTDVSTPEGIFVHTGTGLVPTTATVGTYMQVTGTVALFPTTGPLPGTELDSPTAFTVLSTGNPLPTAITLTTTNPSPSGGFSQLQRYQSMRVAVPSFTVTGPTQGTLTETAETYVSTGQFWGTVTGDARPVREPGLEVLDPLTASEPTTIPRFDDNPELFEVDSKAMLPTPGPIDVSSTTVLTNLSGVMDFSSGTPLFLIDAAARPTATGGMTVAPVSAAAVGETTIGDQNFERFYTTTKNATGATIITAAAYELRKAKASLAIRNVLHTPDILAMEEIEDIATLNDLAARVSSDAITAGQTDPHYVAYLSQGNDTSGINVAFLINPAKIDVTDVTQVGLATTFTQPSTGNAAELNDRPPLVLRAGIKRPGGTDYPVTVIVNHLRSLNGVTDNTGSGQNTRAKREQQAEFLANLVQQHQTAGEHVVVVGDMNAFEFNDGIVDSIGIIRGNAAPANQDILAGPSGLVTPNLVDVAPTNAATNTYSYNFNGNVQSIDHFLVTSDISSITRTSPAHYNADFPAIDRNDPTTPSVGSDHDGIVGYLKIPGTTVLSFTPPSLTFASQVLNTSATQTVTVTNSGTSPITVTNIAASANFSVIASPCGTQIVAATPCVITVTFKPTTVGPITGTLTLTDSDVTGTQTVALSGTGAGIFSATALGVSSGNIVFGANTTMTATVTGNAGTTPTGTVNFLDGTTVLKSAAALNGSGIATFTTTTPLAIGTHSITAVYSGDGTYPTSTSAVGTVAVVAPPVPDFTFSLSNSQIVIPANVPASNTTVSVAMVNGFNSTVSFSCSGLPTASRCSFTPATLSATGSSVLTVTINTSSAALRSPFSGMGEGVLACGLLALPFMLRRKTRTALRRASTLMAVLLLATGLAAISGCGGGGSTGVTPKGTTNVTVTATGGSVTHTATISVVVQ